MTTNTTTDDPLLLLQGDNLMAVSAVRYCIGRRTYIVGMCADWLISVWPRMDKRTRALIQDDLEWEFKRDDEARKETGFPPILPLGDDCDRAEWERVRKLWTA